MYLSAERIAAANKVIQETFEQTSVSWQAIPHWDTGDPGQIWVHRMSASADARVPIEPPLAGESLEIRTAHVRFAITLAQVTAPTPDALLDAVIARTVRLAKEVDQVVVGRLRDESTPFHGTLGNSVNIQDVADALIDARADVEDAGYRSPSCLLVSKAGLKWLSHLVSGEPVTESLRTVANINSLHCALQLDDGALDRIKSDENFAAKAAVDSTQTKCRMRMRAARARVRSALRLVTAAPQKAEPALNVETYGSQPGPDNTTASSTAGRENSHKIMLMLGRRQRIAHGSASAASPGQEPVDLAVSLPPSLEVIGETANGNIELAVRIRYTVRIKDARGVVAVVYEA